MDLFVRRGIRKDEINKDFIRVNIAAASRLVNRMEEGEWAGLFISLLRDELKRIN